jgi:hypothetical protein
MDQSSNRRRLYSSSRPWVADLGQFDATYVLKGGVLEENSDYVWIRQNT